MLLAVDIGNSAIKFGLFEGEALTSKFSIPTKSNATSDEIKLAVGDRLPGSIDAAIVCSVVPEIDPSMTDLLRSITGTDPVFVHNSFRFGLQINYRPLNSLGTDRLVNAFAAAQKYGAPCIVCSLGTATTIDAVSRDRKFLGGIIAPGLDAMPEALHSKAPRLPRITPEKPENLLGNSTEESIQSGIYNGYVAMVRGLIERVSSDFAVEKTILTGGNAKMIAGETYIVDYDLMLTGLRILAGR
jgi:type III pantothenate kinase